MVFLPKIIALLAILATTTGLVTALSMSEIAFAAQGTGGGCGKGGCGGDFASQAGSGRTGGFGSGGSSVGSGGGEGHGDEHCGLGFGGSLVSGIHGGGSC